MKAFVRRRIEALLWLVSALVLSVSAHADGGATLKFVDGTEQSIVDNVRENIASAASSKREIEGTLISFGKATPLSTEVLEALQRKDRKLYKQTKRIRSALQIAQNGRTLYLRALPGVTLGKLSVGQPLRCRIVLLEVRSEASVSTIALIESVEQPSDR